MDALEEENFMLSFSSASDAEFDAVVGCLEDIIIDVQLLQKNFMDKYYQELEDTEENKLTYTPIFNEYISLVEKYIEEQLLEHEDTEENKLTYTPIFNEYISLVEKYIEEQLLEHIPGFNMAAFTIILQHHKDEVALTYCSHSQIFWLSRKCSCTTELKRKAEGLGGDFTVQVIYISFSEQLAALGPTFGHGCDHYEVTV
ncbi:ADP-ribosylation factor 2-binding [Sigmodon hispidus]